MTVPADGSITICLQRLKAGDRDSAQVLWERYFHRLVGLARSRLRSYPVKAEGAEDVALSAFDSVYRRAEQGRFERLDDRSNLWSILFVVTVRKAIDHARREGRRPDGRRAESLVDLDPDELGEALGAEPTPELAAQAADECRRLLGLLDDDVLASVALWRMQGYTNREIAERLGVIEETVERKLRRIRKRWAEEVG